MAKIVDSYRFLDGISARAMRRWAALGPRPQVPWTQMAKPLSQCTVSIVSTAAIVLKTDRPFDPAIEQQDPWFSDPSYRVIPRTATAAGIRVFHRHINPAFIERDLNCGLPLERLSELGALGEVGRSAPSHYSFMGYTLRPEALLRDSIPGIIRQLREERVDAVLLVPV